VNSPQICDWDTDSYGELSVDAVKALHQPPQRHRVSLYEYPAGTSTGGAMMEGVAYVQHGRCTLSFPDCDLDLGEGQFVRCPSGAYKLRVGESDLRMIIVWELPSDMAL